MMPRFDTSFAGLQIVEDASLVDMIEDWSRVRSPGRARRRRRQGHPQNIRMVAVPWQQVIFFGDKLFMHPEIARQLRAKIGEAPR